VYCVISLALGSEFTGPGKEARSVSNVNQPEISGMLSTPSMEILAE
jgi:hypothetical protein